MTTMQHWVLASKTYIRNEERPISEKWGVGERIAQIPWGWAWDVATTYGERTASRRGHAKGGQDYIARYPG